MALKANAHVIRARLQKKRARHLRGAIQAQFAAVVLLDAGKLPQCEPNIVTSADLIRLVRNQLGQDPEYCKLKLGKLDRKTILAAAREQGIVWRSVRGRPRRKTGN
jgi:hypothetical protein